MMRIVTAVIVTAFTGIFMASGAQAQSASSGVRVAQASQSVPTDVSAQRRRLKRVPIFPRYEGDPDGVYPRYNPGPNAVRECTATYVQEYRPSGAVIVPRMNCFWRRV